MLILHRAPRADVLAQALADILAVPPADPFAPEIVSVPTRGVERWLSQTLASRLGARPGGGDGVCANVRFPFPAGIVHEALAVATGIDPVADPWSPERMVWPLIEVVDELLREPWLATLAQHLGHAADRDTSERRHRRFLTLRHLADLFDRYAVHRPAMLRAWWDGQSGDGQGAILPDDLVWQAELWRRLREHVGIPGPAERLPAACADLAAQPELTNLPERVAFFGLTRLPASHLDVLHALAAHRDIHLFLLHPSPALWERVAAAGIVGTPRRADDPTAAMANHPLLASWGRDAREMQLVTAGAAHSEIAHPVPPVPGTLLGRLQADIRGDVAPPGAPLRIGAPDARMPLDPADRSVQVHSCHGRARQVEVVRDAVLHLMAADPTLEPRDVLIMCPDVEDFAPLVHATFAGADAALDSADRPPDLRVRLADRSLRQTNPLLGMLSALLGLVGSRITVSQVVDLAGRLPVRRRFRFTDDDLGRAAGWVRDAGVRWGLDASTRASFGLGDLEVNTWRAGLDRLLLGVAVADDGAGVLVDGVLPVDDVGSHDIALVGRIAEYVDRISHAVDVLAGPHTVAGWAAALRQVVDLLADVRDPDAWQRTELERLLDDVVAEAAGATDVELGLAELRSLLADRLKGRPTRANFRTGHLTVCTLVPMRSVPHRVVCVIGLDDGAFPRRGRGDGDDILSRDPRVGDRDVRGEDRQLLLDALMAAGDAFVVAYSGRHERTNADLPPAVPVQELLDVVDRTAVDPRGSAPASERIVRRHPLQPFDPLVFTPGALGVPGPFGFDPAAHRGARAARGPRRGRTPLVPSPLPAFEPGDIDLADLVAFAKEPVTAFLRQRLRVYLVTDSAPPTDGLPIDLDPLAEWGVGDRMLSARLRGLGPDAARAVEIARGTLPPGAMADGVLAKIAPVVEALVAACPEAGRGGPPQRTVEIEFALSDDRRVVGAVPGVRDETLPFVTYSRLKPSHRIQQWVRLLALIACHPEIPWRSLVVGRPPSSGAKSTVVVCRIPPFAGTPEERRAGALAHLQTLVDLFDQGLREPLPVFGKTSHAIAAGATDKDVRAAWEGDHFPECAEPENVLVLGGQAEFAEIAAGPAAPLAHRMWDGLLALEETEDL